MPDASGRRQCLQQTQHKSQSRKHQTIVSPIVHQGEDSRTFASRIYEWMRASSKNFKLSRGDKVTICFTAMDRKAISETLETFFNGKNHIEMQNTSPKQGKNIISMTHKTENQPFFPHFTQFSPQTTNTYFISPCLVMVMVMVMVYCFI